MLINVTQKNIEEGEKQSFTSCPIALAIKEQLGDRKDVHVDEDICAINGKEYYLTIAARKFVNSFDEGKVVKPFSFNVRYTGRRVSAEE